MSETEACAVLITAGTEDQAADIAKALVSERLAACANIVPRIRSIYQWEGKLEDDAEVLMIVKTTRARLPELIDRVTVLHPYDVPEVIALPIVAGHQPYLNWATQSTR